MKRSTFLNSTGNRCQRNLDPVFDAHKVPYLIMCDDNGLIAFDPVSLMKQWEYLFDVPPVEKRMVFIMGECI